MKLKYDPSLDIAVANNRRAKTWKNKSVPWSEIVTRIEHTTTTAESVAEYKSMSKDMQSEIKDVGAFVGGYCNNGSRSDIRCRSILALDADFAQPGLWDDWLLFYGAAAAIYSTHKHTPEKPRLRLVVPLSRNVDPEEFQAIGRRVASVLGIDQFDDTTYQAQRCMFWPSTSRDGEYIFNYVDAPVLDPDEVLRTYTDWHDVSAWPTSSRVAEVIKKEAARQADPLEKGGLIGAFCRAYSIEEAIEIFVPTYTPCADPGRYTYTEGSTAAGVTTYDGKFSYSFHATDPASGQLCNAWDLVRLHKFGELDADVDPSKPINTWPSWAAMTQLATSDTRVKAQILAERADDFAEPVEDPTAWLQQLRLNKDGSTASSIDNVVVILEHDPRLAGRLQYDEMRHTIGSIDALPWREKPGPWNDSDDSSLRYFLEKHYGLSGKDKIFDAVNVVAMRHSVHPVREYLDGCSWDGVPRVDTLLIEYLGADDNAYTRAVTRKTLAAAVARVYRPGCKFDYMLTLRGRQGLGKSGLIAKLGGEWFSDSFATIQGKDAFEQLHGVWIMEVGELAGMKKAESETIKLFISKQADRFRPAYGRRNQEFPRQCIFIGTTNEAQFLRDATGNRRFWIVDTPHQPRLSPWDDMGPEVVRQVWAEAVQIFKSGEPLYLPEELEPTARDVQSSFEEENPKAGIVAAYLDLLLPAGWADMDLYERRTWLEHPVGGTELRTTVCSLEIWAEALGNAPEKIDRMATKEINDILSRLPGWRREDGKKITAGPYGRQRYYKREGET